uniref:Uncharacterized protein n=1 Tax=Oryza glumipatula TaxID=40148 RepID=A0A0D9Y820_9ORYZ
MDALMKRSRAFAEAVVIMVCPVLLAIALHAVDLKSAEHGAAIPIAMLVMAAITMISGTFPFLALCFSKRFVANGAWRLPTTATNCLAPFSCACLIVLACWIIRLIVSERWANVFPAIGGVLVLCILIRTVIYCRARIDPVDDAEFDARLENSLEFLAGVTALLFLGLEGLALEGHSNGGQGGQQQHLALPLGVSFLACVFGVSLMLIEMIPPLPGAADNGDGDGYAFLMSNYTVIFDFAMAFAVSAVMWSIMHAIMELRALLLLLPLFLILLVRAYDVAVGADTGTGGGGGGGKDEKPASMELTKVAFTGFMAVSIPAVKTGSLCGSTDWFLIFAASAIISGFAWRLLTHAKMGTTANFASFCTHFCIAIATVPFTVMAVKALH